MLCKAKILDAEMRQHKGKEVCDVTLKLTDPAEAVTTTLWNNSVAAGEHKQFFEHCGKDVWVSVQARVWNGSLQYSINSSTMLQVSSEGKK